MIVSLLRSTLSSTIALAMSREIPVRITSAPSRRAASLVCTRWFATWESTVGTPVLGAARTDALQQLAGELTGPLQRGVCRFYRRVSLNRK